MAAEEGRWRELLFKSIPFSILKNLYRHASATLFDVILLLLGLVVIFLIPSCKPARSGGHPMPYH